MSRFGSITVNYRAILMALSMPVTKYETVTILPLISSDQLTMISPNEIVARGNFIDVIISQDGVILGEITIDQSNSGYDIGAEIYISKRVITMSIIRQIPANLLKSHYMS